MAQNLPIGADRRKLFEREALPHLDALYAAAFRLARNADDANDLLQETILRAFRFFHQFTPGTNCRAWLLTILYNVFRNVYRRGTREQVAASAEEFERRADTDSIHPSAAPSNPEDIVLESVLDHEVEQALDALPEDFRTVLLMVDLEELSYQEVARVMELPVGTVKSRVSRGRASMRRQLQDFADARCLKKPMTGS
ncbi:MAG TPA: sigma-70 family RNA polymerase sigma factor [Candidatus Binataceae bacterium]|nr:sigma-70 family RNA polymerase sigma factor [Candidatus Binataceae bacterium]